MAPPGPRTRPRAAGDVLRQAQTRAAGGPQRNGRRGVGDRLVYTADDARYLLTGKTPSIFDAEHGTVWGDSLTFYSHDDRVLVESNHSSPTITRARTTK